MARIVIASVVPWALLLGVASSAWASVGLSVSSTLQSPLTVGQTGVPMSLAVRNVSTGAEASLNVSLDSITLVPSCGALVLGDCPAAADDPGVLVPTSAGTGQPGTACAGIVFANTLIDSTQGKYQLSPQSQLVLGPPGSPADRCVIDFAVDVVKAPSKDADPSPGLQTAQLAAVHGGASDGSTGTGSSASEVTINKPPAPAVSSVGPSAGPTAGGNTVTIRGTHFVSGSTVKFGTTAAGPVTFVSASKVTVRAPAHAAGLVDVRVSTAGGTSAISAADHYTYDARPAVSSVGPNAGSTAGGNTVTIRGMGFVSGSTVKFGTTAAGPVTFVSASKVTVRAPAHAAGLVDVRVSTPGGTSAASAADHYTYR